ncbi:VOC family protein [Flavobacterium sp. HSC-61S13]|uniref:VOC family protein n=1 Tax=Flavobacterium sp. HSC-61S13 TaxID=2910963 RepID=UPI00209DA1F6|nr:VOC family protein [Flavobacterium sp. HSC-61S13]MCP1996200.1 putative enzyme related to lactoylglutathione lyase [Flavobacterium sp. HSC-61S13]
MNFNSNAVVYFEIPVTDLKRAITFYKAVFDFDFEIDYIDHNEMAIFPFCDKLRGISGALVKGEIYIPSLNGTLIYFNTDDIEATLQLVVEQGAKILYPKTSNGIWGYVAEFQDLEGNRIGLHMKVLDAPIP